MQSQAASTDGKPLKYTSTLQTLSHVVKSEGFFSLWKGFTPYFLRSGTHTVRWNYSRRSEELGGFFFSFLS